MVQGLWFKVEGSGLTVQVVLGESGLETQNECTLVPAPSHKRSARLAKISTLVCNPKLLSKILLPFGNKCPQNDSTSRIMAPRTDVGSHSKGLLWQIVAGA